MARPAKQISQAEIQYAGRLRRREPPVSWRKIQHEVNERRGAFRVVGKARRDLEVSYELLRQRVLGAAGASQETDLSRNGAAAEARTRQETREALETRSSEYQTPAKECPECLLIMVRRRGRLVCTFCHPEADKAKPSPVARGISTCSCGKVVGTFSNGTLRPHAVPIEQRKDPKKSEVCHGQAVRS